MNDSIPIKMTPKDIEVLSKKILYKGFYRLEQYRVRHRLFGGGWGNAFDRELLVRYPVAAVLPYDAKLDKVILIEQFRIGALDDVNSPWLLELVAGILTDPKESFEELAKRETVEEAGVEVEDLIKICDYWVSPGGSLEKVALFCAKVDASQAGGIYGLPDENEDILVHVISTEKAFAAVRSGRVNNATTIIALQWLELNYKKIKNHC